MWETLAVLALIVQLAVALDDLVGGLTQLMRATRRAALALRPRGR
jgi:hypothetical protein